MANGTTIKDFLVGLGFNIDESGLRKFNDNITKATVTVTALGAAATAASVAIFSFVNKIAGGFDRIGQLAIRINTTSDAIARLGYVASLTGSSTDAAERSLENLSRTAGEAALGIGRGAKIFKDLGISAKDSRGNLKDTSVLLSEISNKVKDFGKGEQIAAFSKLGLDPTLINALTTDVSGLADEFDRLYRSAGVDINEATTKSIEFNDSITRLGATFDALKNAVGLRFMKQIQNSIDALRKFLVENMPRIIDAISPVINLILKISEAFTTVVGRIGQGVVKIVDFFKKINNASGGIVEYIGYIIAAWFALNTAFLRSPIGKIIAVGAVLALLIDDFLSYREGIQSAIDWGTTFGKSLQVIVGGITALITAFVGYKIALGAYAVTLGIVTTATKIYTGAMIVFNTVMKAARAITLAFSVALFATPFGLIVAGITALIAGLILLVKNWDIVKNAFVSASDSILSAWKRVKDWFMGFFDYIGDKFKIFSNISDKLKNLFSFNESALSPTLLPASVGNSNAYNTNQNINQKTEIVVQGSNSPEATARAISAQQNQVSAELARNMRGVAR